MPEIEQEVKTFTVSCLCEECGDGWMEPTGICLTSNPPQYPHKCSKCGEIENFRVEYPRTIYRTIP